MLADFKADFLVSQVRFYPDVLFRQVFCQFSGVIGLPIGDIQDGYLGRGQPRRHGAFIVLDQDADKALERAKGGTVQHNRRFALAMFIHIFGAQSARHGEVYLDGAALPYPANAIFQGELDFRAVKCPFTRQLFPGEIFGIQGIAQGFFCLVPDFIGANPFFRASGEFIDQVAALKAKVVVDAVQKVDECTHLGLDLIFGGKNMRIVLDKATHPHQPVQGAGRFIAVAGAKLRQTHRQVAVAFQPLVKHLNVARAVHGFDGHVFVLGAGGKHALGVFIPVAGFFPQAAIDQLRGFDLFITGLTLLGPHVLLQLLVDRPAVGVPEHHARCLFLHMEQVEAFGQFAMVTLFRLFQSHQVGFEGFFVFPGGAVDAGQHLVFGITTPVGAGHTHQFERFEFAGGRYMGATAQIHPLALAVD